MAASTVPSVTGSAWRKSSYSDAQGGECVETAVGAAHVGVRDSKRPDGPVLVVSARQWKPFLARTKNST